VYQTPCFTITYVQVQGSDKFKTYLVSITVVMDITMRSVFSIFQFSLVFPILEPLLVEANSVIRTAENIKSYVKSSTILSALIPDVFFEEMSFDCLEMKAVEDILVSIIDDSDFNHKISFCDLTLQPVHFIANKEDHNRTVFNVMFLKAQTMNRLEVSSSNKCLKVYIILCIHNI